jgi:hypothetical protein
MLREEEVIMVGGGEGEDGITPRLLDGIDSLSLMVDG